MTQIFNLVLVLGGGNALGSYHAGVYQAVQERGLEPDWIIGASAGAITGALIAGTAPDHRVARLAEFWRPGPDGDGQATGHRAGAWWWDRAETARRTTAVMSTVATGRPGLFEPVGPLGSWWDVDPAATAPSLFNTRPLEATLARLVDFARLNADAMRFTVGAVDLLSGEDA